MPDLAAFAYKLSIYAIPVLFAITVHEAAHGYVARWLGDDTAARAGRISLNPMRHIDPIGTVVLPGLMLLFTNFLFGWAKPVPVDFRRLRNPRRDMALVAFAGPGVNLLMAAGWAVLLNWTQGASTEGSVALMLQQMAIAGVTINLILIVLNLIPLPPLDGGRIAVGLLPLTPANWLARVEPYGMILLILLLVSGALMHILYWPMIFLQTWMFRIFAINPLLLS